MITVTSWTRGEVRRNPTRPGRALSETTASRDDKGSYYEAGSSALDEPVASLNKQEATVRRSRPAKLRHTVESEDSETVDFSVITSDSRRLPRLSPTFSPTGADDPPPLFHDTSSHLRHLMTSTTSFPTTTTSAAPTTVACDSFVRYQCNANRSAALVELYTTSECGLGTGYIRSPVDLMTCVDSAELDVLMSGERYWFILSCATTDPSNLDVNTVVYSNDACEGLPSFDAEFDVLSQCSCDELGLYNSSDNFNLSPPSPPSPPHPPEAPPLIIVNGSEVFINQSYSNHLQDAIATEQVTTVIITVDVLLDSRLPAVNRTLAVLGRCGSPPESGSERCVIDGSLPGSIFHVQVGGALRLECLALTNQRAMSQTLGGAVSVLGEPSSARSTSAELHDCFLYANHATDKGGAVYVEAGTLLFEGCVLEDNQADGGGAVGGELASVVVRNSTLAGNVANEGAGIHVSHGNVTLAQRALVIQNSAQRVGGGLFCLDCAVVIEGGSDVAQNVVAYSQYTYGSGNGGGVYLTAASRDKGQSVCLTLDGAAITGNVACEQRPPASSLDPPRAPCRVVVALPRTSEPAPKSRGHQLGRAIPWAAPVWEGDRAALCELRSPAVI
ncbi:hypothetical protein CYMTET_52951, partial [Cymbomonas tetramitiformis]